MSNDNTATPAAAPTRTETRSAADTLKRYRNGHNDRPAYEHTDGYAGLSINCGDYAALALKMCDPMRVVAIGEAILPGIVKGELSKRYSKLNPGMQRMNVGNRIRSAIKKGVITKKALKDAIKATPATPVKS